MPKQMRIKKKKCQKVLLMSVKHIGLAAEGGWNLAMWFASVGFTGRCNDKNDKNRVHSIAMNHP